MDNLTLRSVQIHPIWCSVTPAIDWAEGTRMVVTRMIPVAVAVIVMVVVVLLMSMVEPMVMVVVMAVMVVDNWLMVVKRVTRP